MEINNEQLHEIAEMQRKLDKYIMDKQGVIYDKAIANKITLALFVELGELFNELPSYFKYWKHSAIDNRDKALVEFVDCLHFAISLINYNGHERYLNFEKLRESNYTPIDYVKCIMTYAGLPISIEYLLSLGIRIGFTWEEIYETYIKKNKINYDRQVTVREYMPK